MPPTISSDLGSSKVQPLVDSSTHKPETSGTGSWFDSLMRALGFRKATPVKAPTLKQTVGSWQGLDKSTQDRDLNRFKALTVVRFAGEGFGTTPKTDQVKMFEVMNGLPLKLDPCRASQVGPRVAHQLLNQLADPRQNAELLPLMLNAFSSGSLEDVERGLKTHLIQQNPWIVESGITSSALNELAAQITGKVLDGLLTHAIQQGAKFGNETIKAVDTRIGQVQTSVKSRFTAKSDLKAALKTLTDLRDGINKNEKLLDHDRGVLIRRLAQEIEVLEARIAKPIVLPGKLAKLDGDKLNESALRALAKLDDGGFLDPKNRFANRLADSPLGNSIETANATWQYLAKGEAGFVDMVIWGGHWQAQALEMKLRLPGIALKSPEGQAIKLEHEFTQAKVNLADALKVEGFLGAKTNRALPSSFRDIHADEKLLQALIKLDPGRVRDRNLHLANLVIMQFKVDGKDLTDSAVIDELTALLDKLGIRDGRTQVETWISQGFGSTDKVAQVLKGLDNFTKALTSSKSTLEVVDELLDSGPRAYVRRGAITISQHVTGITSRAVVERNPKLVDTRIEQVVRGMQRDLALSGGLTTLSNLRNERNTLSGDIETRQDEITKLNTEITKAEQILVREKIPMTFKVSGLRSSKRGLLILELQEKITDPSTSTSARAKLTEQRDALLKQMDRYSLSKGANQGMAKRFLSFMSGEDVRYLSDLKTVDDKIDALKKNKPIMESIVTFRMGKSRLTSLEKDLTNLREQVAKIDTSYTKALGEVERRQVRTFVRLAVLRAFSQSGVSDFAAFDITKQTGAIDKQLTDWGLTGDALKVERDAILGVKLSQDVIRGWVEDLAQDSRKDDLSAAIKTFLDGDDELRAALALVRGQHRVKELIDDLGAEEGINLKFGHSGTISTGGVPVTAGLSVAGRIELAALDSMTVVNTGKGYEVLVKAGTSGQVALALKGMMGSFETEGHVSAATMKGAMFSFKTKDDVTAFLGDILSGNVSTTTLNKVSTAMGVTESSVQVGLQARLGLSKEVSKEVDTGQAGLKGTLTLGLAVEVHGHLEAEYETATRENAFQSITSFAKTYEVEVGGNLTLGAKVEVKEKDKELTTEQNATYIRRVTHGLEIVRAFGAVQPETCAKSAMRIGDAPLTTLAGLLPDGLLGKIDPDKLAALVATLGENPDAMVTLESQIKEDVQYRVNELTQKGAELIKQNKKSEGDALIKEAQELLRAKESYTPARLVVERSAFKIEQESVRSYLSDKVQLKEFSVGERLMGAYAFDLSGLA